MSSTEDVTDFLAQELVGTLCGKLLGKGAARTVYEHRFDPTLVIKFERNAFSFQNVIEWQTWERVKNSDLAKWFAPCVAISPNGCVLVQRRTTTPANYPTHIPAFFTDLKLPNFGVLLFKDAAEAEREAQFVCHDYGLHLMLEKGMTKRMAKADWWNL